MKKTQNTKAFEPITKDLIIDHLDPLGQGVSFKEKGDGVTEEPVTFIPKTLPGENITAEIYQQKKGVRFAQLLKINTPSPDRIESDCPHYNECSGCDYRHINYTSELNYKLAALKRYFKNFKTPEIKVLHGQTRSHYRNRMQLHYDFWKGKIGLTKVRNGNLVINEIPHCKLVQPNLAETLESFYQTPKNWQNIIKAQYNNQLNFPQKGHIEIYSNPISADKDKSVKISVNQDYADGGFTQVHQALNQELTQTISKFVSEFLDQKLNSTGGVKSPHQAFTLVELFCGQGNLTQEIRSKTVQGQPITYFGFDTHVPKSEGFYPCDLYSPENEQSEKNKKKMSNHLIQNKAPWGLVLDPPRSGYKDLADFINNTARNHPPLFILYVSCWPSTMVRDLQGLFESNLKRPYEINQLLLCDFFPGTSHFETITFLS